MRGGHCVSPQAVLLQKIGRTPCTVEVRPPVYLAEAYSALLWYLRNQYEGVQLQAWQALFRAGCP